MKNKMNRIVIMMAVGLSVLLAACSVQIERNSDGSLGVETYMTGADLQSEIDSALADPLIQEINVNLHTGYATVLVVRERVASNATDEMSFRLELGAVGGHLAVEISETEINGFPLNPEWSAVWNERIAQRLERAGRRNPNSSLEQVLMDPNGLTMVWRIETAQSSEG
jgi:hypothetical protein